jgi:hypothetical protein
VQILWQKSTYIAAPSTAERQAIAAVRIFKSSIVIISLSHKLRAIEIQRRPCKQKSFVMYENEFLKEGRKGTML